MNEMSKKRRVMTSAIDDMTVTEVRKYLGDVRKKWQNQTLSQPFYITEKLNPHLTIQDFALRFQLGHHKKRQNKTTKSTMEEWKDDTGSNDNSDPNLEWSDSTGDTFVNISDNNNTPDNPLTKKRGRPKKNTKTQIKSAFY